MMRKIYMDSGAAAVDFWLMGGGDIDRKYTTNLHVCRYRPPSQPTQTTINHTRQKARCARSLVSHRNSNAEQKREREFTFAPPEAIIHTYSSSADGDASTFDVNDGTQILPPQIRTEETIIVHHRQHSFYFRMQKFTFEGPAQPDIE